MALEISPTSVLKNVDKGEAISYRLNFNPELDDDTIASHTYKIYDSGGSEVTTNFGGGSSEADGYITFGLLSHDVGEYTLEIWVTCSEALPDAASAKTFFAELTVTII